MNDEREKNMDAALRSMTQWDDSRPGLWRKALERVATESDGAAGRAASVLHKPVSRHLMGAIACVLLVVLLVGVMLPSLGKARRSTVAGRSLMEQRMAEVDAAIGEKSVYDKHYADAGGDGFADSRWFEGDGAAILGSTINLAGRPGSHSSADLRDDQPKSTPRAVERKATIELEVADARAAFLKARGLISEASGEFIQGGRIDERDDRPRADLVLRVRAERLEAVLGELREIGAVKNEQLMATDVTEQMVDLDARLKNERQIEEELQHLLESRPDDKLDDILRVRKELSAVREQIERIVASRSQLANLVALSTITVLMVEPAVEPEKKPEPEQLGLWGQFVKDLGSGLHDGVESLLGFVAGLVQVLIAGLPAWLIILAIAIVGWKSYRRSNPRPLAV